MTITVDTTRHGLRTRHEVDPRQVDELDDISGDEQLALVWCETHQAWEWHYIHRDLLPGGWR